MSLVIGTRGSELALWQARWAAERLGGEAAGVRLETIKTTGDRAHDVDLAGASERGLFTRDIEQALLDGRIDLAVHSLKDLPTAMTAGLALAAVPARADAGDVLLVRPDALDRDAAGLPLLRGARVGTGSPRRQALLSWVRADLVAGPFRGNVPTRVDKCRRGDVDAVVLARAGLARLRLDVAPLVAFDLDPTIWVPAPAQGALAVQAREGDGDVLDSVAPLDDASTRAAVDVERSLLARLEAGCHAALGAWCRVVGGSLVMDAGMLGDDGRWRCARVDGSEGGLVDAVVAALDTASASPAPSRCWNDAAGW